MASKAGIPLVELFSTLDQINASLPGKVRDFIEQFNIIDHEVSRSPEAIFHFGKIQAIAAGISSIPAEFDVGFGKLSMPLLQTGIPVQLSLLREPVSDNLEPAPSSWRLDLQLETFVLTLDSLQPAIYIEETGTTPQHLLRDPAHSTVRITGHATLRIEKTSADSSVQFRFIDLPDPLDPLANTGVVASISVNPPHFFIGGSEFGLSVGRLLYDGSEEYTPAAIVERGHNDSWTGLSIREATFYAPRGLPAIGDLSAGVKDVLLGRPMGVQGELEIQFGRTALDASTFRFVQGNDPDSPLPVSGSGARRMVTFEGDQDTGVEVIAGLTATAPPSGGSAGLSEWHAIWDWSNGISDEGDSSSGIARQGSSLKVTPVEVVSDGGDSTSFRHPDITFRFQAAGTAPGIRASVNGRVLDNIVHLGGSKADIEGLTLEAVPDASSASSQFEWYINGQAPRTSGNTYTPSLSTLTGTQYIVLEQTVSSGSDSGPNEKRVTRLQLEIRDSGDFLIGCESGVFKSTDTANALQPSAIEATYDLSDFHSVQELNSSFAQASLQASSPFVSVPAGALAQLVFSDPPSGGTAPEVLRDRHVQILMDFDTKNELTWGEFAPVGATSNGAFSQRQLLSWAARYPGADFIIVGRCGDLGTVSRNKTLAQDRGQRAFELLTQWTGNNQVAPVSANHVFFRGEQSKFTGSSATGDALEEDAAISLTAAEKSEAVTATAGSGWLIKAEHPEHTGWPSQRSPNDPSENIRKKYRRVDIYAVGGTPDTATVQPDDEQSLAAEHRRSLVPANGRNPVPVPAGAPKIDYRVKLRAVWDSPVAVDIKDAIPTLAEAEFAWSPHEQPLPEVNSQPVDISREVLTIFAKWLHDIRTGYTKLTLGIESDGDPDGLFKIENDNLTTALALGPALLSGVNADTDLLESGAKVAALLAASAFATIEFSDGAGGSKQLVSRASNTAIKSITAETEMRSLADPGPDMQIRLLLDYIATLHIFTGQLGLQTDPERPLKIRYRRAGLEYDSSKEGWEKIGLAFDSSGMEVVDPGKWQIDGVLGSLLRITDVTVGRGSLWFEMRIAVALSIGVVEISEAIVRLTWSGLSDDPLPAFELRGLVLKVDIPNTIKGEGRVRIEDHGLLRAGVKCDIIPVGLGAEAALALSMQTDPEPYTFLSLYLGVQFSTPLPLAQSGIAIYGFRGMFGMNAQRKLPANNDPIARELAWFAQPPENKYEPELGQYALGVGAVVGTMPDVSFCFSCEGMVFVGFPDPEVIFGVKVKIVEVPDLTVKEQGSGSSAAITGLIVIDDEAVKVGVIAEYEIPKVLHLKVPFSAYFPYPGTSKSVYVRIGADGVEGRLGDPVTVTLLPDTLDAKAWSYLMIEEGGLPKLGGDARFNFEGFSVGFGAGWDIHWSAGPIKLSASAKVLVGFGTAPLIIKGGVFVAGELSLVVVSISARGELILEIRDDYIRLDGEFCGKVDLFFFDIEGCVGVSIGSSPDLTCPPAANPVGSIGLTDRRDRMMGIADTGVPAGRAIFDPDDPSAGSEVDKNNVVWPDTAPVIHFKHYIENNMVSSAQFTPGATPSQPKWTGSSELKYAYRLDNVLLRKHVGHELVSGDKPLQSVWMTTPYRQPESTGEGNPIPSEHEGVTLKLLDWEPWNWSVNMDDGAEGQHGDPAKTVERLCDPLPLPKHACLYGRAMRRAGLHRIRLYPDTPPPTPYPSHFTAEGFAYYPVGSNIVVGRDLQVLAESLGGILETGMVQPLPFSYVSVAGETVNQGYRLPNIRLGRASGIVDIHLPYQLRIDRKITRPVVTLMVCDRPDQQVDEPDTTDCVDFHGVNPRSRGLSRFEHQGIRFSSLASRQKLFLRDKVDQSRSTVHAGADRSAEIHFPNEGMLIRLPRPCKQVTLHVMLFKRSGLKIIAFTASGVEVDATGSPSREQTPHAVTLNASDKGDITEIHIFGGNGEAALFKLCCESTGKPDNGDKPSVKCEFFKGLKPRRKTLKTLQYHQYEFTPLDHRMRLRLVDYVDLRSGNGVRGSDGNAEISFPHKGMRIKLPKTCDEIALRVMLFSNAEVVATALNEQERVLDKDSVQGPQSQPLTLRLNGNGITYIELRGGASEALLFAICCVNSITDNKPRCLDFDHAKPLNAPARKYQYQGLVFHSISRREGLSTVDRVDLSTNPATPGSDNQIELRFPDRGVVVEFPKPCQSVDIYVMLFEDVAVQGVAVDAEGNKIIQVTGKEPKVPQILRFAGKDIQSVTLEGGGSEAVIYKICCNTDNNGDLPQRIDDIEASSTVSNSAASRHLPVIKTLRGNKADADAWHAEPGESKKTEDGLCQVVTYEPPPGTRYIDALQIVSPAGKQVSLISLCGIDKAAVEARQTDQERQDDLQDTIDQAAATPPDKRREIVLTPDTEYELVVQWSWQCWQATSEQKTPPDTPPADQWQSGDEEVYRFKTAADHSAENTPQDGLNEYIFDARDVSRYLIASEPADGRSSPHFLDDPIWIHFDAGHVEQLLEMYGRELQLEVFRTDPPPQPGANLGIVMQPVTLDLGYFNLAEQHQPVAYQRINTAISTLPCISADAAVGGTSLAASSEELIADADYDLVLSAPSADSADKPVVYKTRFHTSRYANPRELLDDLGYRSGEVAPYQPDDLIIPEGMALPTGDAVLDSDAALDAALAAIDADTLPLPEKRPRSYILWRLVAGAWHIEGLLIDSLEALKRERTVASGSTPTFANRCTIHQAAIQGSPGSPPLRPFRANVNWTRVLLKPESPIQLPATAEAKLRLIFNTSDGTLQGERRLPAIPSLLQREGL